MNVLHLIGGDLSGGAARGAYWLHHGLLELGVDSRVLTTSKETYGDPTVTTLAADKKGKLGVFVRRQVDGNLQALYRQRQRVIFSTGLVGRDFTRCRAYQQADIVHLHWICGGMVNMRHLAKIEKPMIWTMRDMWPMTGGCHCAMECERYTSGCGRCPQLGSKRQRDLSRWVYTRKKKYIPGHTKLVGISHWLSDCARQSDLFQDFDVRTIHNNVSTKDFFPVEKAAARQMLGIDQDRPVVLAGTHNMESFYKGFADYLQALEYLDSDVFLLFFGKLDQTATEFLEHDFISLGFLHDTVSLRLAYSAADVFVAPSRMDAFGKTLAESMACGTPVVCFDATGPKDIVEHKVTGYKAKPFEAEDLACGIQKVLSDKVLSFREEGKGAAAKEEKKEAAEDFSFLPEMGRRAREKVVREFDARVVAGWYRALYGEVLGGKVVT